jgi:hypothetical protein
MKTHDNGFDEKGKGKIKRKKENSNREKVFRYIASLNEEQISRMMENSKNLYAERHVDPTGRAIMMNSINQKNMSVQAKLEISQPGDSSEMQADKVADAVSRGDISMSRMTMQQTGSEINAKGEGGTLTTTPEFNQQLESSKGSGTKLDEGTKSEMEHHMGADLSGVNIHTGTTASTMSENINAKAFTHGQDVYFKDGNYNPSSSEGKNLLAHELTHTVQQGSGKIQPKIQRHPNLPSGGPVKGGFSVTVTSSDNIPSGDPQKIGLRDAMMSTFSISEDKAWKIVSGSKWQSDFTSKTKGQQYSISVTNSFFLNGLGMLDNEIETFSVTEKTEDPSKKGVKPSSEESEDEFIITKIKTTRNLELEKALGLFYKIATPFTPMQRYQLHFFEKLLASITTIQTKYFFSWAAIKKSDLNLKSDFSNLGLDNIHFYTLALYEFVSDPTKAIADAGLTNQYAHEADDVKSKDFEEAQDRVSGIDSKLIKEYCDTTGYDWIDFWRDVGPFVGVLIINDKPETPLDALDKKLNEKGYGLNDIKRFLTLFEDIAVAKAFQMLDDNKKLLESEQKRYQNLLEVYKLFSFIKGYKPKYHEIDKIRAKGISEYFKKNVDDAAWDDKLVALLAISGGGFLAQLYNNRDNIEALVKLIEDKDPEKVIDVISGIELFKEEKDFWKNPSKAKLKVIGPTHRSKVSQANTFMQQASRMDFQTNTELRTEGGKEFPILADLSIDYRVTFSAPFYKLQKIVLDVIAEKISNNDKLRGILTSSPKKVWNLTGVLAAVKNDYQIVQGSNSDLIINDHVNDLEKSDMWESLGLAALGVVLGLLGFVTFGATTYIGASLIVLSIGVSAIGLFTEIKNYKFESAAYDTAIGTATELSDKSPSIFGIIMAAIGLGLDIGGFLPAANAGLKVLVRGTEEILATQAIAEMKVLFKQLSKKLAAREAAHITAEEIKVIDKEIKELAEQLYDFVGKTRIKGNLGKEAFVNQLTERLKNQTVSEEFINLLKFKYGISEDIITSCGHGLALINKENPSAMEFLLKNLGDNPRLLTQFSIEAMLNKDFPAILSRFEKLLAKDPEALKDVYRFMGAGRKGIGSAPKFLDAIEAGKITDVDLIKTAFKDGKVRTLVTEYPDPSDLTKQWKAYNAKAGPKSTFGNFVEAEETARLSKIQKIGGELPKNAQDYAGRTFYFSKEKNTVWFDRLTKRLRSKEITQSEYDEAIKLFDDLNTKYPNGIKFNENGFPDFSSNIYTQKTTINGVEKEVKAEIDLEKLAPDPVGGGTKGSALDMREANKLMKEKIPNWVQPKGYTWHHVENSTKLILIKTELHEAVRHSGGRATFFITLAAE